MRVQSVIGPVPEHWEIWPFFATGKTVQSKNNGMREDNLLSLSYGRIVEKDIDSSDGLLPESFETYQIVEPNDMVFRFTDLQNDQRSLRSALVRDQGIITSAYLAFRPNEEVMVPRFLDYLMRAYDLSKVFYPLGGGVRQSLKFDDVKRLGVIVPPLEEQKAIADYLDRELAQIDALIEKQEKLISVITLRMQSQVSIAAVSGKMGASNATSETWKPARVKHLCKISSGQNFPIGTVHEEGSTPIYGGNGIRGYTNDEPMFSTAHVVIGRVGAHCGNTHVTEEYFSASEHCLVLEPKIEYDSIWFAARLRAMNLRAMSQSAAQPLVTSGDIRELPLALPSLEEQRKIGQFVNEINEKSGALLDASRTLLVRLKERRQSLISAAVTGKIDVRKVA
jgi:type I restriction enzyme S subunit